MDILEDILTTLGLKGALYFRTDCTAPWAIGVPPLNQAARFHLVLQGNCHVKLESGTEFVLNAGELVLIPRGQSHTLSDRPVASAPPLEQIMQQSGYSGSGVLIMGDQNTQAPCRLICGHFTFRNYADHPLLHALPSHIIATSTDRAKHPLLDEILRLIGRRLFDEPLGADASVIRMSEIVFIEILRIAMGPNGALQNILGAFRDKHIGHALQLMHADPARAWTVNNLAAAVGMSRSRFAEQFKELLGVSPMAYLAQWRLQKALPLLDKGSISIQQIANTTGYQSHSAFTRAFASRFGLSPSDYRRHNVHPNR